MAINFGAKMSPIEMNLSLHDFLTNTKLHEIPGLIKKIEGCLEFRISNFVFVVYVTL